MLYFDFPLIYWICFVVYYHSCVVVCVCAVIFLICIVCPLMYLVLVYEHDKCVRYTCMCLLVTFKLSPEFYAV